MPFEPKARLADLRILAGLFCAALALSACTPTTENPMTGSANPSDPATVKAQVEELKQALADLHAFKTETQQAIGPQKWVDKGTRNMDCRTSDGQDGVNYSILTQTPDPVDLEASVSVVRAFWESKGFTTRTETNPREPGLIRLYANENGGHLLSYFANIKGSGLEMNSACVAGDQTAIYKELYPEIYGTPSSLGSSPSAN
ncbi:hypothetical protein LN996_06755 [Arthrobacter sp. AK01]|uniref:hypothetical protein n=1 Tax=Micrococcaceae TaxID=1268 RepID=UPI001E4722C8|nr:MULTISPECIES: hypothetical protein [Micrococcaceae]MCD4850507.1 hypothetical protein [Arthrobacter sp. AK01]MCP1411866.1 hypothetical protein [Paenarthrobacter sp. A20]